MTGPLSPGTSLYLDTSVALHATLERGTTPEIEAYIAAAPVLVTSRLSLVESARALHRLRQQGTVTEGRLVDARRELDALHLATFLMARRRIEGLEWFTADVLLREAAILL